MADFVTVLTVSYPQQLWIIKVKLESEGIECFVKDELTVQSNNLWSNAVGGVKLQVQQPDVNKAIELLTELGYINEEINSSEDLLTRVAKKTDSIPILRNLKVTTRIVVITLLFIFLITSTIYFAIQPSKADLLIHQLWTVDKIYYKGRVVGPKTVEILNTPEKGRQDLGNLGESIIFNKNSELLLPGVNCSIIEGDWKSDGDRIIIKNTDTLGNIFNGSYQWNVSETNLTLRSGHTIIIAHRGL